MSQKDNVKHEEMIVIAKIGATYRLKGELNLYVLSDSVETALSYPQWYIKTIRDRSWSILIGESIKYIGSKLLIQFADAYIKEVASKKYTNALLAVPRSAFKETAEDEYYWVDLIGMQVFNKEGKSFGQVDEILDTSIHEVICCKYKNKSYLIPFIKQYVIDVNKDHKCIIVDWQYDY